jgi:hypothetical protein
VCALLVEADQPRIAPIEKDALVMDRHFTQKSPILGTKPS